MELRSEKFFEPEENLIGLTGGIGAGKSVVARILRSKGFEVYDCDLRAKELMQTSEAIRSKLISRFGEDCFLPDGSIHKKYLANRIFTSPTDRMMMNFIVHRAVREDLLKRARSGETKYGILFVESAILKTSMLDRCCSQIWIVTASEEARFERAMLRGGIDAQNLRARIHSQRNELENLYCDEIREIDNSEQQSLLKQVDELLVDLF